MGSLRTSTSAELIGAGPSPQGRRLRVIWNQDRMISPDAASSSATPSMASRVSSKWGMPFSWSTSTAPRNAEGTEPTHSHSTSFRLAVRRTMWTIAPAGFMNRLLTTSLEIAVRGSTPEEEDQDRGHQGAAAHSGQADDDADEQTRQRNPRVHSTPFLRWARRRPDPSRIN